MLALIKSFESREFVKCTFNWRWNYAVLTPEGVEYLRQYLGLPEDIVPETVLKSQMKAGGGRQFSYQDKAKEVAPGGFNPEYSSYNKRQQRNDYRE